MSFSPSSIIIILLSIAVITLFAVTLHIKGELTKSRQDAAELQTQLDEAIAQRDADRLRIIDAARRLDEALTLFVNNSEDAHYDHETRMENLSNIETNEAVDWLCDPVPDDIRRLFCIDSPADSRAGNQTRHANGVDAAVH